jgi:hypothetical protein
VLHEGLLVPLGVEEPFFSASIISESQSFLG